MAQSLNRYIFVSLALCAVSSIFAQSPVLVRDATVTSVLTLQGNVAAHVTPITPSHDLTIIVLADTLAAEDAVRLRREIATTFNAAFLSGHRLQLVAATGGSGNFSTPLTTPAQLQAALKQIVPAAASQTPATPEALIEMLGAMPASLPANWANAVIAGRLPDFANNETWIAAWLGELYRRQRVRLSFWSINGAAPPWAQSVAGGAMGMVATGNFNALLSLLSDQSAYFEVGWEAKLAKGGWPYNAELKNAAGEKVAAVTSLASAAGYLPQLTVYLAARVAMDTAPATDETAAQKVLSFNPSDLDALRRTAKLFSEQKKFKESADAWRSISEITPSDGAVWSEVAKNAYAGEAFDDADGALTRAANLGVKDASTLEIQARIRIRKKDFAGALTPVEEALVTSQNQQSLWLLRAECARELKLLPKETESVERAAALGEVPAVWTKDLIAAYLEAGQPARAIPYLRKSQANLSTNAAELMQYARFWELAQQPKEAEPLWQKAITTDPKLEAAYLGLVANYTTAQRYSDAGAIAERGLSVVPHSLPLLLAKEQALEHAGDLYGARRFLAQNAASASPELLKRRAALQDIYGGSSADAYVALVKALRAQDAPQKEVMETCRRGVVAALREERPDAAKILADTLATGGDHSGQDLIASQSGNTTDRIEIPGGSESLEFLLLGHSNGKAHPDQIMVTAANLLGKMNPSGDDREKAEWQHTVSSVHEYFQRIASLQAMGQRKAHAYEIVLSLNDKPSKQRTEKVFEILGLKMHRDKEGLTVAAAEGKSQTKKQDVLAALAIDDQAIQEALGAGKPYTLEIPFDSARIFPAEDFWRNGFYEKGKLPGGLVEAFVTDIRMPRLYAAFNSMDRAAAQAFAHADSPKNLAEHYSMGLWLYSAALAMNGNAAEVPGGDSARSVWTNLAGADPASGVGFFQALLRKDDGRLMSFFYTLSQLDMEHQRFFTRSSERTKRFYELFRNSLEIRKGGETFISGNGFVQFLREVPLNDDLSVDFPGSPEVWMVAKGIKVNGGSVAKLTRKMKKSAAPDDEDQILIRLAGTSYKDIGRSQTELANLIVVARIDAQRTDPLTPESALLLAQGYTEHQGLYAYLTRLGDLETADYEKLLALETKCEGIDMANANMRLGELHAFLALAGAVHDSAAHNGSPALPQFLPLFRKALDRFIAARDGAGFTTASLSFVSELVPYVPAAEKSADKAVRCLLLGVAAPSREKGFDQVLALQKIPSLDSLLSIERNLNNLNGPMSVFDDMQREVEKLPVLDTPKAWKVTGDRKKAIDFYDTSQAEKVIAKLRLTAAKHKKNEDGEMQKLAANLRVELEPWVELATVGRIYARYLDGSDLLVSEDPLLVRKHEFVTLGPRSGKPFWFAPSGILISSESEGSYFVGGLGEFSIAAGQARAEGNHLGGGGGESFATALFASVRATDWHGLNPTVLSSFGATVRLAREWIVESAAAPDMRVELGNAARGVLSLSRRKALLKGVEEHDWSAVWQSVSVSDLHFLGDELIEHAPAPLWQVPQLQSMKQAAQHTAEPDMLGSVAPDLSGCAQPRLKRYEPYEEYERQFRADALSQRLAELKLSLAWLADNAAWQPELLIRAAEPAADALLNKLKMHDARDWNSALDAYRNLKIETVETLVNQQ